MVYYLFVCFLAFFAVVGICQFIGGIVQLFIKPKGEKAIILIEPICKSQQDAEYLLRCAAQRVKWMGKNAPDRVICLDCDMDGETKKLCKMVCRDYPFIEILTVDELLGELRT